MFEDNELLEFAVELDPRIKTVMFSPAGNRMNFEFWDHEDNILYSVRIDPVRFSGNILDTLKECLIIEYKNREAFKMPDYTDTIKQLIDEGTDAINHPSHYTQYKGVEVIDICEHLYFCLGNAVKYIARAGFKDPDTETQDLEKGIWYIDRMFTENHELEVNVAAGDLQYAQKARLLIEQMNYHRGNAVDRIVFMGRNPGISAYDDLKIASEHLASEIRRLRRDYEAV